MCADVGEFVQADEVVARIETDKVTVDILSQHAGVIKKFFAEEGDTVEVGGDLMEIDTDGKAPEGGAAPKQEAPAAVSISDIFLIIILPLKRPPLLLRPLRLPRLPHHPLRPRLPPLPLRLPPHRPAALPSR